MPHRVLSVRKDQRGDERGRLACRRIELGIYCVVMDAIREGVGMGKWKGVVAKDVEVELHRGSRCRKRARGRGKGKVCSKGIEPSIHVVVLGATRGEVEAGK